LFPDRIISTADLHKLHSVTVPMAFFLARQRASFLLARRSALAIRYPIRCRLYCTRSPVRASNVDSVGLSCPMNNVHALFDEDRHKRIALRIFSDAMSPFSQNPKCFLPPTCIVSYHPAPPLPGHSWCRILGFGTRFASLWAHPLPMLTLSQPLVCLSFHFARIGSVVPFGSSIVSGWPPDWS